MKQSWSYKGSVQNVISQTSARITMNSARRRFEFYLRSFFSSFSNKLAFVFLSDTPLTNHTYHKLIINYNDKLLCYDYIHITIYITYLHHVLLIYNRKTKEKNNNFDNKR